MAELKKKRRRIQTVRNPIEVIDLVPAGIQAVQKLGALLSADGIQIMEFHVPDGYVWKGEGHVDVCLKVSVPISDAPTRKRR